MHDSPPLSANPADPHDPPLDWPDRISSEFHLLDGIRWHVQRAGTGPTILLVHGTGGGTHSWAALTPTLRATHRVVSIDLPGHAYSLVPPTVERARNPFALTGMSRLLARVLDHLGEHPTIVVGHSAGVSVLLRMVLDGLLRPDRIVGVCPALVAPPAWYVTLIAPVIGAIVETDVVAEGTARLAAGTRLIEQMLASTGSPLTPDQLARYRALCTRPAHVHAAVTMMARWDLPALQRDWHALRVPLHLVVARGDRWIPVGPLTRVVQGIPGMTMQVEEGGHLLPEERPECVARAVLGAG